MRGQLTGPSIVALEPAVRMPSPPRRQVGIASIHPCALFGDCLVARITFRGLFSRSLGQLWIFFALKLAKPSAATASFRMFSLA
jgi:hypothetical protein